MSAVRLRNGMEYALEFVEGLPASYTCTHCHQFLGEAYQNVECGDRFCWDCVRLITNGAKKCPECSALMTQETTFVDTAVRREMGELEVCCPFKRYDCGEMLLYRNLVDHIDACSKKPVGASAGTVSSAAKSSLEIQVDQLDKPVQDLQLELDGSHNQVSSLVSWTCNSAKSSADGGAGAAQRIREMARWWWRWLSKQVGSVLLWKSDNTLSSGGGDAGADRSRRDEAAQGASPVHGANALETGIPRLPDSLQCVVAMDDLHDQTSHEGVFIWKIDNFRRRKKEAVDGVRREIHSSPFYSHRCGYKMYARVYLNGTRGNEDMYLSLFIVLMKGEYDDHLDFPFPLRIKFTLVDQVTHSCDFSGSSDPDPTALCFQRPTNGDNCGAGAPRFVPQIFTELPPYLKDDCIYLRIAVGRD